MIRDIFFPILKIVKQKKSEATEYRLFILEYARREKIDIPKKSEGWRVFFNIERVRNKNQRQQSTKYLWLFQDGEKKSINSRESGLIFLISKRVFKKNLRGNEQTEQKMFSSRQLQNEKKRKKGNGRGYFFLPFRESSKKVSEATMYSIFTTTPKV